ncbi:hypothetical protein D9M73_178250 [compost metagenome]
MDAMSASVANCAARAAAAGSMMLRTLVSRSKNWFCGLLCISQCSTSGSSMCQSLRGLTTVPTRGREYTRPLATNTRVASRSTGRLTAYSSHNSASAGSLSSGRKRPETICMPSSWTMRECMLLRSEGLR